MIRNRFFNIVLNLAVMFAPLSVFAQQFEAKDPKAMELLDKAYKVVDGKTGYAVKFTIEVKNNQSGKKEKGIQGTVDMLGEKFRFSVNGIDTYFDGKTEYVYMKENNEVTISVPDQDQLKGLNPIYILRSYKDGYKMQYIGTDKTTRGAIEIIDLFPEDLKSPYARITLSLNSSTLLPVCIHTQGKNGVNTMIQVDDIKTAQFTNANFVFDEKAYKDVEVIDLR